MFKYIFDHFNMVLNLDIVMRHAFDGLEYFVKDIGANAAANNITFTPNGADVMEGGSNITTNGGSRHFQFFSGTWWIL